MRVAIPKKYGLRGTFADSAWYSSFAGSTLRYDLTRPTLEPTEIGAFYCSGVVRSPAGRHAVSIIERGYEADRSSHVRIYEPRSGSYRQLAIETPSDVTALGFVDERVLVLADLPGHDPLQRTRRVLLENERGVLEPIDAIPPLQGAFTHGGLVRTGNGEHVVILGERAHPLDGRPAFPLRQPTGTAVPGPDGRFYYGSYAGLMISPGRRVSSDRFGNLQCEGPDEALICKLNEGITGSGDELPDPDPTALIVALYFPSDESAIELPRHLFSRDYFNDFQWCPHPARVFAFSDHCIALVTAEEVFRHPRISVHASSSDSAPIHGDERERVRHAKFGDGTIVARDGSGETAKVTVEFATGTRKLLAASVRQIDE